MELPDDDMEMSKRVAVWVHTRGHTRTICRCPLDEESTRRRDLYLGTHNVHKGQTSIPPTGFELAVSASERRQTHATVRSLGLPLSVVTVMVLWAK